MDTILLFSSLQQIQANTSNAEIERQASPASRLAVAGMFVHLSANAMPLDLPVQKKSSLEDDDLLET